MGKIVQFEDGKYAYRYGFIFHKYLDLVSPRFTWSKDSGYFRDCLSDTVERIEKVVAKLDEEKEWRKDKGKPVK